MDKTLQLDNSQRAFCGAPQANIRLLAPAGCGKTLCLLQRCMHLVNQSYAKKQRFLIVTFTRVARDELVRRIKLDEEYKAIREVSDICTLNSWGHRRIKRVAFSPTLITSKHDYHFTMRNQLQPVWQNYEPVRNAINNQNLWKKSNAPRILMDILDSLKSLGFDHVRHTNVDLFIEHWNYLEELGLNWQMDDQTSQLISLGILDENFNLRAKVSKQKEVYENFFQFWIASVKHLIESSTFTYEDQKYFAFQDERRNFEEGRTLSGVASYDHVLVDEFQDINPLDLALIKAIVDRSSATLTIAGDDDQAIFGWRGATPKFILQPDKFFGTKFMTYTLEVNYRSPRNIVSHSQRLISFNHQRVTKNTRANSEVDAQIEIVNAHSLNQALEVVASLVENSMSQGDSPSRIALISRKRSQIIPYQIFFSSKNIPFCAAEDLQVFLSDTFTRLLNLLEIQAVSENKRAAYRIVNDLMSLCDLVKRFPLKKSDKESLKSYLLQSQPTSLSAGIEALIGYRGELKGKNPNGQTSLEFAQAIHSFISAERVSSALIELSRNFEGLQYDFGKSEEDIFYTDPPFIFLAEYAERYERDYDSFVNDIELAKSTLVFIPPFEQDTEDNDITNHPLHLMTALRAKGKEFDKVVLLDVKDDIWPAKKAKSASNEVGREEVLESERRVFYVAFTRAKEKIVLLVTLSKGTDVLSPYIQELGLSLNDVEYIEME